MLVTNRASYNLVFNNYVIYNSDNPNESLRKLANLLQERGIAYLEHLPVTLDKPYEYTLSELSSTWQGYFKDFLNYREWDSDISAAQLMKQLRSAYRIPNDWTDREVRLVCLLYTSICLVERLRIIMGHGDPFIGRHLGVIAQGDCLANAFAIHGSVVCGWQIGLVLPVGYHVLCFFRAV